MQQRRITPIGVRLWRKVDRRGPDECWPWLGATIRKGYGQIGKGRSGEGVTRTHRVAYVETYGPIPEGMHVLHRCDNPPCCNPAHLFLGTNAENSRDKYEKGRGNTAERNGQSKLTAGAVSVIRQRRSSGETLAAIAGDFGVSIATIQDATTGRTWTSVA